MMTLVEELCFAPGHVCYGRAVAINEGPMTPFYFALHVNAVSLSDLAIASHTASIASGIP